jgi:hypothetical protein
MLPVFEQVYIFNEHDQISKCLDIFKSWMDLTPDDIIKSCDTYTKYITDTTDKTYDQDLMWTPQLIKNSISDPELITKVEAAMAPYEEHDKTGPLYFYMLITTIAGCSKSTLSYL